MVFPPIMNLNIRTGKPQDFKSTSCDPQISGNIPPIKLESLGYIEDKLITNWIVVSLVCSLAEKPP